MTQEEKQLLLKDLCARLSYAVKIKTSNGDGILCSIDYIPDGAYLGVSINGEVKAYFEYQDTKPYLRPMSSMTKDEREYLEELSSFKATPSIVRDKVDFYLERHLDYRGLIPMGLALEAPEGMYKTNKELYK